MRRTYRPVRASEMARTTKAPPNPPLTAPRSTSKAVIAPTIKVEVRGFRGGFGQ